MTFIHSSAVVDKAAKLGSGVKIGPFCIVGPDVELGTNVELLSHVVVTGRTKIGSGTKLYPFASIGHAPQDLKYKGEPSTVEIGENNKIREYVTIQPGTVGGNMKTVIGDNCLFMASTHVAHDCRLGNNIIMANLATLAGHVQIDDYAVLGGLSAVHQYVRIGKFAMVGGMSGVPADVIPFGMVTGNRGHLSGLNLIGLKRGGYSRDEIHNMRAAYTKIFNGDRTLKERLIDVEGEYKQSVLVQDVIAFIRSDTERQICTPELVVNEA